MARGHPPGGGPAPARRTRSAGGGSRPTIAGTRGGMRILWPAFPGTECVSCTFLMIKLWFCPLYSLITASWMFSSYYWLNEFDLSLLLMLPASRLAVSLIRVSIWYRGSSEELGSLFTFVKASSLLWAS